MICICDNCGEEWTHEEIIDLGNCKGLAERLTEGSVVPDGECPDCHAFCYRQETDQTGWNYILDDVPRGEYVHVTLLQERFKGRLFVTEALADEEAGELFWTDSEGEELFDKVIAWREKPKPAPAPLNTGEIKYLNDRFIEKVIREGRQLGKVSEITSDYIRAKLGLEPKKKVAPEAES